jgi:hypothetical protein
MAPPFWDTNQFLYQLSLIKSLLASQPMQVPACLNDRDRNALKVR